MRSSLRDLDRDRRRVAPRGGRALQRGGLPLDVRAPRMAALHPAVRPAVARAPRRAARRARKRSSGTRSGPRSATGCSRARRRGSRGGCSRTSLEYHQREAKPQWWAWFRWPQLDEDELIADRTALGGLRWTGCAPELEGKSHAYRMSFRPQEHKISGRGIRPGDAPAVPRHGSTTTRASSRCCAASTGRTSRCRTALTPGRPLGDAVKRDALMRFARPYADGVDAAIPALTAVLERRPPDARLDLEPVGAALSLEESYLFVQGPPGSGQDVAGRPDGDRAHAGGEARRRHLAQPQGDPQLPPCRAARGRPARVRVRRRQARRAGDRDRVREPVHGHVEGRRCLRRPGVPARRGHRVGLLARGRRHPRGGAAARRALRRRGRATRARRRARGRDGCAVPRPARRPEPAAAGLAGLPPGGVGALGARAPPRRPRDRAP